jgi:transitional endoplasmic reticulum ATPase
MPALALHSGDLVIVTSERGRRIPARVGDPIPGDEGKGRVRLDRFLRQALKTRLGQFVEIEPLADAQSARRILLSPAIDVSAAHHLNEHLRESFASNETPVAAGSVLYATFHGSTGGTTYRVLEAEPGPGVITGETEIEIQYVVEHAPDVEITYEDVGGLGREIRLLRELVQLPLTLPHVYRQLGILAPRGIILYGPPGAGKTLLMKAIASEVSARFYYVNGPDIIGTYYGEAEANLRRIFDEAAHHAPSIIFFDEVDAIAPRRGTAGTQADTRLVSQLLALLDGIMQVDGVVAIATTNRVDSIEPALRRPGRFDREIYIGPPDADGRLEILSIHTREMPLTEDGLDFLPTVAARTHGFVGADLVELSREASLSALRRHVPQLGDHLRTLDIDLTGIQVTRRDFEDALGKVRPSAIREALVTIPNVRWDDVGGLRLVKERLEELVILPLRNLEAHRRMGLAPATGILLYGPPGTGKTHLARALAHAVGVNFIAVDGPEIFSQWLGESEEAVRHIFKLARQLAPSIVFIDQLDAIAPRRGTDVSSRTSERVVNQLLAEMDGIEEVSQIVVVGATNRMDLLDSALLRPGRFGIHLEVGLPDRAEREDILRVLMQPMDLESKQAVIAELARETDGFSAADLAALLQEARRRAVRATERDGQGGVLVTDAHLLGALEFVLRSRQRSRDAGSTGLPAR